MEITNIFKVIFVSLSILIVCVCTYSLLNEKFYKLLLKFMGVFWWIYPLSFLLLTISIAIDTYPK